MSKLFLVPTPVGNLEDMTLRGIRILKESSVILAEDTRTSGQLLKHFGIEKKMLPYHQHNEHKVVSDIVERISSGENIALISVEQKICNGTKVYKVFVLHPYFVYLWFNSS